MTICLSVVGPPSGSTVFPLGSWLPRMGRAPKTGTQEPGRHTVEPLGGPTTLREMVTANHDYRGDW